MRSSILLLIPFPLVAGCMALPGMTAAECDLRMQFAERSHGSRPAKPNVVISYWWHQSIFGSGSLELLSVVRVDGDSLVRLKYPLRLYPIFWTPALGVQHVSPDPAAIAFREGCAPGFASGGKDFCCAPPRHGVQALKIVFNPPGSNDPSMSWDKQLLQKLADQSDEMDRMMQRAALPSDLKIMVYEQLRDLARELTAEEAASVFWWMAENARKVADASSN